MAQVVETLVLSAETLVFQWHATLAEFERAAWQRLSRPYNFPFLDWDWLNLLETSGCVGGKTGWLPLHLGVWRSGRLIAAAALYVKFHSRGEFVFDQQIAEISEQLNLPSELLISCCRTKQIKQY